MAIFTSSVTLGEDFVHDVMPILQQHCGKCHTGNRKEGGFSINTRATTIQGGESGPAIIVGNASESLFIERITEQDDDLRMPPEGERLTEEQVAALTKWVNEGLKWEDGITLGPNNYEPPLQPRMVALPPARNGRDHPIDRLLDFYLVDNQKAIPGPISDAAFLRRASLDANGLLPSPPQLNEFVKDQHTNKRELLVDRLLNDDVAYADHWLTTWNDLLRNDYTGTGFITGGRKQITTWLYAALRANKPYDQMVRELISPSAESAGFINGIQWRGDVNASQTREIQFAQNVSQVFLGINMKCASCHDSFIDRWKLSEAYNLAAIYADSPLELNRCDKPAGKMATPKWIFPEIGDVDSRAPKAQRLEQLAGLMTHPENGRFTRTLVNRIWERLMGRGIVHPVDAMHTKPWNEDLLDFLAVQFASDGYDLRKFIRFIMTSEAYQSQTVLLESESVDEYVYGGPIARRMSAEQFIDSVWQLTGANPAKPNAKVDRSENAMPAEAGAPSNESPIPVRAKWIWHPRSSVPKTQFRKTFELKSKPTVARLMVTCDNAFKMRVNGKAIATSRDWQKPVYRDIAESLVAGRNELLFDAEMFGGAAGFICQITILDQDQRTVIATDSTWESRPPNRNLWLAAAEVHNYGQGPWGAIFDSKLAANVDKNASGSQRPVRAALVINDILMRSLGRPHRDQVVTSRPRELTTLQAIDLSNGDMLAGYLSSGAKRIVAKRQSASKTIDWLYEFALSRLPTDKERRVLMNIAAGGSNQVAIEDMLWTVIMLPEFQIIR